MMPRTSMRMEPAIMVRTISVSGRNTDRITRAMPGSIQAVIFSATSNSSPRALRMHPIRLSAMPGVNSCLRSACSRALISPRVSTGDRTSTISDRPSRIGPFSRAKTCMSW